MASRKQRRKARIRASARAARRPAVDFIQLVRQALAENNGRRALDALKQAEKSQRAPEGLDALFYCAAACRSRNLAEKGMHKEAAAMRARAVQYRSAVRVAELAPEDLRLFLASLEPPDAMATYAVQASGGSRETHVERMLADRLVVDRCWDALEKMGSEHPFRMDAESAKPAVLAMEGGDWVDAAEAFRKVGRRSPFAPWRVFCKAMVHFGEGDAENLKRAVSQLPDDFVMAGTVAAWKEPDGGSARIRNMLGLAGGRRRDLAREFTGAIEGGGPARRIAESISRLARYLLPERPEQVYLDLLQIAALATIGRRLPAELVAGAARILLPREQAYTAVARMGLLVHHKSRNELDAGIALEVMDSFAAEYPEPGDRRIARGCVLESMARTALELRGWIGHSQRARDDLQRLMGHKIENTRWLSVELLEASLRVDPDNREGYQFLCELIRLGAPGKGRIESLLKRMASRYPRDPAPLLEMATNYYSRNAYRKAEEALTEAARRAPHDERILDLQAIGFLKSATQGAKAGRFGRARSDLARAESMKRSLLSAVVPAKRILVELMEQGGNAGAILSNALSGLSPVEQLRTLLLLEREYSLNDQHKRYSDEDRVMIGLALARRQDLLCDLGPDERLSLLRPLPADFRVLYQWLDIASIAANRLPELLSGLEGDPLLEAMELLFGSHSHRTLLREIDKRLAGSPTPEMRAMLRFYRAVVDVHLRTGTDPGQLAEIVHAADPPLLEKLKNAAQRLARYVSGDLAEALRRFDFDVLELRAAFPFGSDDDSFDLSRLRDLLENNPDLLESIGLFEDDDEGYWEDDDPSDADDLDQPDMHDAVHFLVEEAEAHRKNPRKGLSFDGQVAMLEVALQKCGWAGYAPAELRKGVEALRSCPVVAGYLDSLARQCAQNDMRDMLSPTANVLLHWGSARRRRGSRKR